MTPRGSSVTMNVGRYVLAAALLLPLVSCGILVDSASEESTQPAALGRWVTGNGWTRLGQEAVTALRSAADRGLRPENYTAGLDSADAHEREAAVNTNLARYAADIRKGRHNPGLYEPGDEIPTPEELLETVAADPDGIEAGLRKLDPPFDGYRRLVEELARLRSEVPFEAAPVALDANGEPVTLETAASAPAKVAPAPELTKEKKIALLELNLERWRWLPHHFERGPILVNLPEYKLRALHDDLSEALEMKVVVGQPRHATPRFMGSMSYVVFAPYWNVPSSIVQNELIPDIQKDRGYLKAHNYEVRNSAGEVISTGDVSDEVLAGLKSGANLIRQRPGAGNALGHVKFMLPNKDNIYLHDTNARSLFARESRALSHGCVRVADPKALAEWVLRDETQWSAERIAVALKGGKNSERASIARPIPVLLLYFTATVDPDGTVHYLKDIYGHDAKDLVDPSKD